MKWGKLDPLIPLLVFSFSAEAFFKSFFSKNSPKNPIETPAEKPSIAPNPANNGQKLKPAVVIPLSAKPHSLDPRRATSAYSMRLTDLLFQPLIRLGPGLKPLPALAKSFSYKDKTYTFVISRGVRFSNGQKLRAEDLTFSIKEFQKSAFATAFRIIKAVTVQEKPNEFVLQIKLKQESAKFLQADLPILKILPKELAEKPNFSQNPVGTGPFKLKTATSQELVFWAWEGFSGPPPRIKEVIFKVIRDDWTRTQKMMNQELDIAQNEIPFHKMDWFLNKKEHFKVFKGPGLSTTYLLLNLKDNCLKHKKSRLALAHSIDRLKIIQYKLKGYAVPATSLLVSNHPFFNATLKNPALSPQKAKKLFKDLPVECKKPLSFKTSHIRSAMEHGGAIASDLERAGFKIKRESYEWGRFYRDLNEGRFQLALLKWVGVMSADIYRVAFHSAEKPPRGRNRSFYSNKELDRVLDTAIRTMNLAQRKALYAKAQKIIHQDLVFIPLWHEEQVAITKANIPHYQLNEMGDFRYLWQAKP